MGDNNTQSQGLTFEKLIIDAGDSFAPGRFMLPLAAVMSLEGINRVAQSGAGEH